MTLTLRQKLWIGRLLGFCFFAFGLVLTPRFFVESYASTSSELVPVQNIQPFERPDGADYGLIEPPCYTDRLPEHSIYKGNVEVEPYRGDCQNIDEQAIDPSPTQLPSYNL